MKKYYYHDCKHVVTPFDSSVHLFPVNNDNDVVNQKEYASIIDSLRYAINCTRPDIAYAVGVLSKFTSKPSRDYWQAIERVMKYLSGTKSFGFFFIKSILLYLKVSVLPSRILCQVILYLPLVTFLLWVVV